MLLLALLWILILVLLVQLILYEPLTPVDVLYSNNEKGAAMTVAGQRLTQTVLLPKNTRKLEIIFYNDNPSSIIACRILQGNTAIGRGGKSSVQGFSSIIVDIQRSYTPTTNVTISLEETNKTLRNITLKSVKAWVA